YFRPHTNAFHSNSEQDVFCPDVLVVEPLRLLVRKLHDFTGAVRESFVHCAATSGVQRGGQVFCFLFLPGAIDFSPACNAAETEYRRPDHDYATGIGARYASPQSPREPRPPCVPRPRRCATRWPCKRAPASRRRSAA